MHSSGLVMMVYIASHIWSTHVAFGDVLLLIDLLVMPY